jgi:cellulose synthase/poly-beta-1,6-N-acetylglucosamine synthase-like glycosyltransferase
MSSTNTVAAALGVLASLFWIAQLVEAIRYRLRAAVWLDTVPGEPPAGGWPPVAVVFAARNEAAMVEEATRSMLRLDYHGVAVVAVDDRSTDATGAILDALALAAGDWQLQVVHVQDLPTDWLGKTHALQQGAADTSAQWLLFTDADVLFREDSLRRAIAFAEGRGLDHLAVVPEILTESFGERIFVAMFLLIFNAYSPPRKVWDPRSRVSVGVGAFNLVRAHAFRAIGGFRHLALSVDEDMRLGQALKFAGYRTGIALGQRLISVRWQEGLGGMIRGLEKNFFAGAGYRLSVVVLAVFGMATIGIAPHAGLVVGPWWARVLCGLGVSAIALILWLMRRPGGVAWYHALALPIGAVACITALIRSTVLAIRRRGIRWREQVYPLSLLREHVRRREEWAREVWRSTR